MPRKPTTIVACDVFRAALQYLGLGKKYPHVSVRYLPSNLHVRPHMLKDFVLNAIDEAQQRRERSICLYGDCFPDICGCCQEHGAIKVPGAHCYEILLGRDRFKRIMNESAGTYFLEHDLIQDFENLCLRPLELYDDEMREYFFQHYQRVIYVKQPLDGDLMARANELAAFLDLILEVEEADYSLLERELSRLIEEISREGF